MLSYSNSVSCSISENKNEYVLMFRQVHPVVDSKGNVTDTIDDLIAEVVMNRDTAIGLRDLLNRMIPASE